MLKVKKCDVIFNVSENTEMPKKLTFLQRPLQTTEKSPRNYRIAALKNSRKFPGKHLWWCILI